MDTQSLAVDELETTSESVVLEVTRIAASHNLSLLDFLALGQRDKLKNPELRELYENNIDLL